MLGQLRGRQEESSGVDKRQTSKQRVFHVVHDSCLLPFKKGVLGDVFAFCHTFNLSCKSIVQRQRAGGSICSWNQTCQNIWTATGNPWTLNEGARSSALTSQYGIRMQVFYPREAAFACNELQHIFRW